MEQDSKYEIKKSSTIEPEISIVVPVYNVENYLEECLESILTQTFQDFELILVDDGSIDKSGEICDAYAKKDSRIRVIHQKNQGQAVARNEGVQLAKAEWILFVDSDDVVHSQMADFLYKSIRKTKANVSTCMRLEKEIIPENFHKLFDFQCDIREVDEDELLNLYKQDSDVYWALFPSIIKKEIVEKIKFEHGKIYEDNALSCQWLYEAKTVAIIPHTMYFYRINPTSTMHSSFSLKQLDYLWALRTQIEFFVSIKYKKLVNIICKEYIGATLWMCKQIDEKLQDEKIKKDALRKTEKACKKYKQYISQYHYNMCAIERMLHPYKYRIKKKLGLYKER